MRTRIAMVGAGGVARRHADVLGRFHDALIVGVTDPASEAAARLADAVGAPVLPGVPELLDATDPDAVYVCVPPFAHGPPERELIERGIPFFVEKPLACDAVVAEELAAEVTARGLLTACGYQWRYLDGVQRARELLQDAPVHLAIGAWLDEVPPVGWWVRRAYSGGQVVEQVTHVLDLMVHLLGPVRQVYAMGQRAQRRAYPDADVDVATSATLRFASGAVGSIAATSLLRGKHRVGVELVCEGRRLALSEDGLTVDDGDGEVPVVHPERGEPKRQVDRAFVDAVQGRGADVRAPYEVALRTHQVACAITRSAREGVPVELEPVP